MSEPAISAGLDLANLYGLPGAYSTLDDEYEAAQHGAIFISRNARGRMRLFGEKARDMLTGLVTNDVSSLLVGHGLYAAALTAKGKVIADLRIYAREDGLWVDAAPLAWPGWWTTVRKFINPRLARYEDLSASHLTVSVYGPRAAPAVHESLGAPVQSLEELTPYGHLPLGPGAAGGFVARVPDAGMSGFDIWAPSDQGTSLIDRLRMAGVVAGGAQVAEVVRVEAGRPEWGIDMDDATLAQEANLDELHAISYTKGCYTGQETVARVHFRGHVNRHLRGLRIDGDDLPTRGTEVQNAEGQPIGEVRSVVRSPRLGIIAMAMIRREVGLGGAVRIGGGANAEIVPLPFE